MADGCRLESELCGWGKWAHSGSSLSSFLQVWYLGLCFTIVFFVSNCTVTPSLWQSVCKYVQWNLAIKTTSLRVRKSGLHIEVVVWDNKFYIANKIKTFPKLSCGQPIFFALFSLTALCKDLFNYTIINTNKLHHHVCHNIIMVQISIQI